MQVLGERNAIEGIELNFVSGFWDFFNASDLALVIYTPITENSCLYDLKIVAFNESYQQLAGGHAKIGNSMNYLPMKSALFWFDIARTVLKEKKPITVENYRGAICPNKVGTGCMFPISQEGKTLLAFMFVQKRDPAALSRQRATLQKDLLDHILTVLKNAPTKEQAILEVEHLGYFFDSLFDALSLMPLKGEVSPVGPKGLARQDVQVETF